MFHFFIVVQQCGNGEGDWWVVCSKRRQKEYFFKYCWTFWYFQYQCRALVGWFASGEAEFWIRIEHNGTLILLQTGKCSSNFTFIPPNLTIYGNKTIYRILRKTFRRDRKLNSNQFLANSSIEDKWNQNMLSSPSSPLKSSPSWPSSWPSSLSPSLSSSSLSTCHKPWSRILVEPWYQKIFAGGLAPRALLSTVFIFSMPDYVKVC